MKSKPTLQSKKHECLACVGHHCNSCASFNDCPCGDPSCKGKPKPEADWAKRFDKKIKPYFWDGRIYNPNWPTFARFVENEIAQARKAVIWGVVGVLVGIVAFSAVNIISSFILQPA